ncbi:type II secretion system protein [Planctomycetota bacterium]
MAMGAAGRRGATVVETTVVIIVFGVLLSILMPTVGLLRENALSTRCQQHLRALHVAMEHYMVDYRHENWLPASTLPDGPYWFEKLEPFVTGGGTPRAREAFVCPRAPIGQRGFARDSISLGWNERYLPFRTLSNVPHNVGETTILADSLAGPEADIVLPKEGELRLDTRHRERANVLFLGGNVATVTRTEAEYQWPRYWDLE